MKSYNILLLSVGRRVELVNCFKSAAKKLNINSVIVGCDCQDSAPALYFSDRICILPRISSPDYIDSIIDAGNENDIALIIPTIDTDLLLLAKNKAKIESMTKAKLLISDPDVIEVCQDKLDTQLFMEKNGLLVPHMYTNQELENSSALQYPLFIKPSKGSSSIDAFKVNNEHELTSLRRLIKHSIVQDFMEGDEYTVDAFLDFDSKIITVVPRLRIFTRDGEISKGRIIKDREIIAEVKKLLTVLKPIGPITVQCIKTKKGIEFIEINPRFGGGATMSIFSGADSCANLYKLLLGERLQYNEEYIENMLVLRFDASVCLDEKMEIISHNFGVLS